MNKEEILLDIIFVICIILIFTYLYMEFGDCMFEFGRDYYRCVAK